MTADLEQIQASWEEFLKESGRLPRDENEGQVASSGEEDIIFHQEGENPDAGDNSNNNSEIGDSSTAAVTPVSAEASIAATRRAKPFTPEEDEQLQVYVRDFCSEKGIDEAELIEKLWRIRYSNPIKHAFWKNLRLPDRSYHSIHNHVKRLHQRHRVRPRKWDQESDEQLTSLVEQHGSSSWSLIGSIMHRSPESCRDRWRNYSVCGNNRNSLQWSVDETELLKQIVKNQPAVPNWGLVSALMGHKRSRIQCRYKWHRIQKEECLL